MSTTPDIRPQPVGVGGFVPCVQEVRFEPPRFLMSAGPKGLCVVVVAAERKLAS